MTLREVAGDPLAQPQGLRIRPITQHDLPALEWNGLFTHFRHVFWKSYAEQLTGERRLLVAEQDHQIIGRLFILHRHAQFEQPPAHRRGYLYSFYVLEAYRGSGVGSALLRAAEAHLVDLHIGIAALAVARTNHRALQLYQRHGYRLTGQDKGEWSYIDHLGVLRKVTEPCYFLEKNLPCP